MGYDDEPNNSGLHGLYAHGISEQFMEENMADPLYGPLKDHIRGLPRPGDGGSSFSYAHKEEELPPLERPSNPFKRITVAPQPVSQNTPGMGSAGVSYAGNSATTNPNISGIISNRPNGLGGLTGNTAGGQVGPLGEIKLSLVKIVDILGDISDKLDGLHGDGKHGMFGKNQKNENLRGDGEKSDNNWLPILAAALTGLGAGVAGVLGKLFTNLGDEAKKLATNFDEFGKKITKIPEEIEEWLKSHAPGGAKGGAGTAGAPEPPPEPDPAAGAAPAAASPPRWVVQPNGTTQLGPGGSQPSYQYHQNFGSAPAVAPAPVPPPPPPAPSVPAGPNMLQRVMGGVSDAAGGVARVTGSGIAKAAGAVSSNVGNFIGTGGSLAAGYLAGEHLFDVGVDVIKHDYDKAQQDAVHLGKDYLIPAVFNPIKWGQLPFGAGKFLPNAMKAASQIPGAGYIEQFTKKNPFIAGAIGISGTVAASEYDKHRIAASNASPEDKKRQTDEANKHEIQEVVGDIAATLLMKLGGGFAALLSLSGDSPKMSPDMQKLRKLEMNYTHKHPALLDAFSGGIKPGMDKDIDAAWKQADPESFKRAQSALSGAHALSTNGSEVNKNADKPITVSIVVHNPVYKDLITEDRVNQKLVELAKHGIAKAYNAQSDSSITSAS